MALNAPPIVLLHPAVLNARAWDPVARSLAASFLVLVPDLPGHGERRAEPFSLRATTEMLRSLIAQHGGKALVAGDSLGGYAAIAFAAAHPDMTAGVVAAGCTLDPVGKAGVSLAVRALLLRVTQLARGRQRTLVLEQEAFASMYPDAPVREVIAAGLSPRARPQGLQACAMRSFSGLLAEAGVPALLVNSEGDFAARRDEKAFLRSAPRSRLEVIPGRRHGVSLESPGPFAAAVTSFAVEIGWIAGGGPGGGADTATA